MSPVHIIPLLRKWVKLVKQMIIPMIDTKSIRIIHPSLWWGKVVLVTDGRVIPFTPLTPVIKSSVLDHADASLQHLLTAA